MHKIFNYLQCRVIYWILETICHKKHDKSGFYQWLQFYKNMQLLTIYSISTKYIKWGGGKVFTPLRTSSAFCFSIRPQMLLLDNNNLSGIIKKKKQGFILWFHSTRWTKGYPNLETSYCPFLNHKLTLIKVFFWKAPQHLEGLKKHHII